MTATCALIMGADRASADVAELPSPADPDSHERFAELLEESRVTTYRKIVALYDKWLADHPDDVGVALERCRFMESAQPADDEDYATEPFASDSAACSSALLERHGKNPGVLLFRIEHLWGQEALDFGLGVVERRDVGWNRVAFGKFCQRIAFSYFWLDDLPRATRWAARARQNDGTLDVAIIFATDYQRRGLREDAIGELARASSDMSNAQQKVSLLLELEAFREALKLIAELVSRDVTIGTLQHAEALEGAGETEAARKKYAELTSNQWNRQSVLRRLLYIDIRRRDQGAAIASYRALRDEGFLADPMLRYRLSLAAAFPLAAWQWRDLLGVLGFLALFVLVVLLPAVVIVPAHYVGLLRASRGVIASGTGRSWSTKQLWRLLAALLLVELFVSYVLAYESLHALVFETSTAVTVSTEVGAQYAVLSLLSSAVAVFALTFREDLLQLLRSQWRIGKILGAAFLGLIACYGAIAIGRAVGWDATSGADAAGITLTTTEMLRALSERYGLWVLFPLVAILVPIYEEVVFRGVLLGWLNRQMAFGWANTVQAATFTLVHDAPENYPGIFVMALLAGVYMRRASGLAPAIALHAALNFVAATAISAGPSLQRITQARRETTALSGGIDPGGLAMACAQRDFAACSRLASAHRNGTGVAKDPAKAAALNEQACNGGRAEDCTTIGYLYRHGIGVSMDPERGALFAKQGCDGGDTMGCNNLAAAYEKGVGVEQNFETAALLYQKASASGLSIAHDNLGHLYATSRGVPEDLPKSVELFRKACAGGHAPGCLNLANAYRQGRGVAQDPAMSLRFARLACEGDYAAGCNDTGVSLEHGVGDVADAGEAAGFYRKACDGGFARGCANLARLHEKGIGVAEDADLSKALQGKACELGLKTSCPAGANVPLD